MGLSIFFFTKILSVSRENYSPPVSRALVVDILSYETKFLAVEREGRECVSIDKRSVAFACVLHQSSIHAVERVVRGFQLAPLFRC